MPARHTDSASVWGFAIYPASQRVQEHGPLCGLAIGTPPGGSWNASADCTQTTSALTSKVSRHQNPDHA